MRKWWERFKHALGLNRCPVLTPEEFDIEEQRKLLQRLYKLDR